MGWDGMGWEMQTDRQAEEGGRALREEDSKTRSSQRQGKARRKGADPATVRSNRPYNWAVVIDRI